MLALVLFSLPFASGQARAASYSQAELDQMLAPVALYPDPLLSQILMASTRPEEVAEAARWSADHRAVEGDTAVQMVQEFDWDPSVKSLVAFPTVLERMGQSPDWTRSLGDAFIAQEPQVMETVQMLRQRAQAAGSLISDDKVRIIDEPRSIAIVPANPQMIYVPYYDPLVAYGTWWWSAYPPFAWDPWPGYAYRPYYRSAFWWGAPVGISVGFFFGGIDWPRRHVRVVRTDNYYVRPWIERRSITATPGRWRPDYWQRRDVSRRSVTTQQAPTIQQSTTQPRQFSAPSTRRQFSGSPTERQSSGTTTQRQFSGTTTTQSQPLPAPTAQPRRSDEPRRFQRERRTEARPPAEWRRPEARQAPTPRSAVAPAPSARQQAAPPARIERAPAPRAERAHAPRMERAAPPSRADRAARAERADPGPPARAQSRERGR